MPHATLDRLSYCAPLLLRLSLQVAGICGPRGALINVGFRCFARASHPDAKTRHFTEHVTKCKRRVGSHVRHTLEFLIGMNLHASHDISA